MFACGINDYSHIYKVSNNEDSFGYQIINPPIKLYSDMDYFSSISINRYQVVLITKDGKSYVRGYNCRDIISGSLPSRTFTEDTEFVLKNERGLPFKFISVVCGICYTLYLVSDESCVDNFKLVYCYEMKKPNPLFLNIGNRTPQALFGGHQTSGVIDSEGGIIIISDSIFKSPTQKIETSFLPLGDKAVKLACCSQFVISLGQSGRAYFSEISEKSPLIFSEVKELSDKTVIDISGSYKHCFAVLNDGRVFGLGDNDNCKLGLPSDAKYSKSAFTEIYTLNKYKIVSVFAGPFYSIFKTSEGKMIVCGYNHYGQLFVQPKSTVYPPEEVPNFQGFSFCIAECNVSAAFVGIDPPSNIGNNKISSLIERNKIHDMKESQSLKEEEISSLRKEISQIKEAMAEKLKEKNDIISQINEENGILHEKNEKLVEKVNCYERYLLAQKGKMSELTFVDLNDYEDESVIGEGTTSSVKIVIKQEKYAKKELLLFDYKAMQRFLFESEILFKLRHPCIIRVYGFSNGDDTHKPSIILSLEPSSLETSIKNNELDKNQKNLITVELVLGMRYIHRHKFMHRDLKPSNIFLSKNKHVRISDFGLAKEEDLETSRTKGVGTLRFMAPELFEENEDVKNYTNKIDVYSFGIILIFIVTESYPPFGLKRVLNGVLPKLPENVSTWVRELVFSCLSVESENRPSFAEIYDILKENNFDLFSDSKNKKLNQKELKMKEIIESRVTKIEAFEFQHKNDFK